MQCQTVLPAKTFNNCLQYFVIECRIVGFVRIARCRIQLPRKVLKFSSPVNEKFRNLLGTFNITLKLNSNNYT